MENRLPSSVLTDADLLTNSPIPHVPSDQCFSQLNETPHSVPCMSPGAIIMTPTYYQKMPSPKETFLAYVVAIRDPLNLHLDIYWPEEIRNRYDSAIHYEYTFISEELSEDVYIRPAYSCHLRGVEIISTAPNDFFNMKEAYITVSKHILRSGGWVLVSVSDIDIYRRILINIFDVVTRKSINNELLKKLSSRTGEPIAKEYTRPVRNRTMFQPDKELIPKDYSIVF